MDVATIARAAVMRAHLLLCVVYAIAVANCRPQAGPAEVTSAPPLPAVPVGPLPGIPETRDVTANPFAEDPDALAEGRRFFLAYNCAGCHGDHGGGGMGPSLRDATWIYGSTDAQIASSIAQGRAYGMPAWEKMLTPAQTLKLTAYLKSLRTAREPSPPV